MCVCVSIYVHIYTYIFFYVDVSCFGRGYSYWSLCGLEGLGLSGASEFIEAICGLGFADCCFAVSAARILGLIVRFGVIVAILV